MGVLGPVLLVLRGQVLIAVAVARLPGASASELWLRSKPGGEVLGNLREPWGVLGKLREYWRLLGYLPPQKSRPLITLKLLSSFGLRPMDMDPESGQLLKELALTYLNEEALLFGIYPHYRNLSS